MALITLRHVKWLTNYSSFLWQAHDINTCIGWHGPYRGLLTSLLFTMILSMLPLRSKQGDLFLTILSITFGVIDWFYIYSNGSSIWLELGNLTLPHWIFFLPLYGFMIFGPLNTFIAAPLIVIILIFKGIEKMWDEGDEK